MNRFFLLNIAFAILSIIPCYGQEDVLLDPPLIESEVLIESIFNEGVDYSKFIKIRNISSEAINVQFTFKFFQNQRLVLQSNNAVMPWVTIAPDSEIYYIIPDNEDNSEVIGYHDFLSNLISTGVVPEGEYSFVYKIKYKQVTSEGNITYALGEVQHNQTIVLANAPTIISPANGEINDDRLVSVPISWNGLEAAKSYKVRVHKIQQPADTLSLSASNLVYEEILDGTTAYFSKAFSQDTIIIDTSNYEPQNYYCATVQGLNDLGHPFTTVSFKRVFLVVNDIDTANFTYNQLSVEAKAKKLGVGQTDLQQYFASSYHRSLSNITAIVAQNKILTTPIQNCNIANGSFEGGTFDGWWGTYGTNRLNAFGTLITSTQNKGFVVPERHKIMSKTEGFDPNVGGGILPVVAPSGGDFSLRLGSKEAISKKAQSANITFVVDVSNADFSFTYALVLQDPGSDHKTKEKPFFNYRILDLTTGQTLRNEKIIADENNPFFKAASSYVVYRNWTCVGLDLNAYMGHTIQVSFLTAACTEGGHYCYAYIDGICNVNANMPVASLNMNKYEYCINDDIIADGTGSIMEENCFWEVGELIGGVTPNYTTSKKEWFTAIQAGYVDIKKFYTDRGGVWECGKTYFIKLAVSNACKNWNETIKTIVIKPCFKAEAGVDVAICSTNPYSTTILGNVSYLVNPPAGVTFIWDGNAILNKPYRFLNPAPTQTTAYKLRATTSNGCYTEDEVTVFVQNPPQFISFLDDKKACSRAITAVFSPLDKPYTFAWENNHNEFTRVFSNTEIMQAVATFTNACGTVSSTYFVPQTNFTGNFPEIVAPDAMAPNDPVPAKRIFFVQEVNKPVNTIPAYNATEFELNILDRWGGVWTVNKGKIYEGSFPTGFYNRCVTWDGMLGNTYADGAYTWFYHVKNCDHPNFVDLSYHYTRVCTGKLFWKKCANVKRPYGAITVVR